MTTTTTQPTAGPAAPATVTAAAWSDRRAPWRSANGRRWILQAVLAVLYVMAAAPKLTGDPGTLAQFAHLGIGAAGMHLIGTLEVAGAIGLLIPRLCGLAALAFVALMSGATMLTVVHLGLAAAGVPAAFLAVAAFVAWTRRDRTARLAAAAASVIRRAR